MQDSKFAATLVIVGTATLVVAASVYYLTSSKKKVKNVLSRESFISNRNLSWFKLPLTGAEAGICRLPATDFVAKWSDIIFLQLFTFFFSSRTSYSHDTFFSLYVHIIEEWLSFTTHLFIHIFLKGGLEQLHPEGPNIGYNSNSSWFDNKQTSDSDNILSQTKGS